MPLPSAHKTRDTGFVIGLTESHRKDLNRPLLSAIPRTSYHSSPYGFRAKEAEEEEEAAGAAQTSPPHHSQRG